MFRKLIFVLVLLLADFSCAADNTALLKVNEIESKYGIKAWFVPKSEIPMVFYTFVFKGAGYAYDSKEKLGLANLVVEVLNEGSNPMTNRDFIKTLERLGGKISYNLEANDLMVAVSAPKETIRQVIELFCTSVAKPKLDEETLSKVKGRQLAQLKREEGDPLAVAKAEFFRVAFPDSGYSNVRYGKVETINAVKAEDIKAKIINVFTRINMRVAVLGNTHAEDIKAVLDDYLIEFPLTMMEVKTLNPPVFSGTGRCIAVEKNIPQNIILFGHEGLSPIDKNFYNLLVLNHILGGDGLESILMQEIREKKGYTYGIYTRLQNSSVDLLLGMAATSNDNAPQVRESILAVLSDLKKSDLPAARIESAKSQLLDTFILRMDTSANALNLLVKMQQNDLGVDYIDRYLTGIRSVESKKLNLFAKTFLNPESILFVNVGAVSSPTTGVRVCPKQ